MGSTAEFRLIHMPVTVRAHLGLALTFGLFFIALAALYPSRSTIHGNDVTKVLGTYPGDLWRWQEGRFCREKGKRESAQGDAASAVVDFRWALQLHPSEENRLLYLNAVWARDANKLGITRPAPGTTGSRGDRWLVEAHLYEAMNFLQGGNTQAADAAFTEFEKTWLRPRNERNSLIFEDVSSEQLRSLCSRNPMRRLAARLSRWQAGERERFLKRLRISGCPAAV